MSQGSTLSGVSGSYKSLYPAVRIIKPKSNSKMKSQCEKVDSVQREYQSLAMTLSDLRVSQLATMKVKISHAKQLVVKLKSVDSIRCQEYASLLSEYISVSESASRVSSHRIHGLSNGDTIVDMNLELTLSEKRFANTGWFKKNSMREKQLAVLGSGGLGFVVRAVNMSKVFEDLDSISIQDNPQAIATKVKNTFRKNAKFVSKHDKHAKNHLDIILEHATDEAKQILKDNEVKGVLLPVGGLGTSAVYPLAHEKLESGSVTSFKDFKKLVLTLATGLSEMHKLNIVHRDISLQNVLLLKERDTTTAKLSDLDLAVSLETAKRDQEAGFDYLSRRAGNAVYQSKSLKVAVANKSVKVKQLKSEDVYALGLVLHKSIGILSSRTEYSDAIWDALNEEQKKILRDTVSDKPRQRPTAEQIVRAFERKKKRSFMH